MRYAAQVPADTHVYLSEPRVGLPPKRGKRGRPRTRLQVLSGQRPHEVRALAQHPQTAWQQVAGAPHGTRVVDSRLRGAARLDRGRRPEATRRMVGDAT